MPGSSHGSDARSMQAASRSEVGSPVAGNAASAPGLWATRTLADAVRQGPQASSSSSQPAQHQLRPPAVQPMGHYQSAVLGLGRPHPKLPQPAAPPPLAPAQHAASAAPVMEQQQKVPFKAQRQRENQPGEAAQLPSAPANERSSATPAQTPAAVSATNQFTLSDGDFPTLGAAGSGRRRVPKAEDPSPSSSAAATPKVRGSRLPSFSASSSPAVPRWGPAAKAQQAPAQVHTPFRCSMAETVALSADHAHHPSYGSSKEVRYKLESPIAIPDTLRILNACPELWEGHCETFMCRRKYKCLAACVQTGLQGFA